MLENHEEILENNERIKKDLNVDSNRAGKDLDYSKAVGDAFMETFLPAKRFSQFDRSELDESLSVDPEKSSIAEEIRENEISFVVIRPEISHMTEEIRDFLLRNKYEVLDDISCSRKIGQDTYWEMYKKAITRPEARESMPTRTMVYTGGHSQILFFRDMYEGRSGEMHMADVFFKNYKGIPGVPQKNTLRGDIVYNEVKRLGFDNPQNSDSLRIVDPISSYRHFVNRGSGPHSKSSSVEPLLFYTGVCIHVPDYSEISNDLMAIFSKKELGEILEKIESNK